MTMLNHFIKFILVALIIITPIAFGSIELWAFSIMELGILLIIILWAVQFLIFTLRSPDVNRAQDGRTPDSCTERFPSGAEAPLGRSQTVHNRTSHSAACHLPSAKNKLSLFHHSAFRIPHSAIVVVLLVIFLLLILFQLLPLPPGLLKILSPKTYELQNSLSTFDSQLSTLNFKFQISLLPFATQIEFFKWLTLIGLFFFLLYWKHSNRDLIRLLAIIMLVGAAESLYGMFEFFSGHKYILHLNMEAKIASVTGTFINRNYFAGYLLMVIPLTVGFLFSREAVQIGRFRGWRERLVSLDGKTLLIAFGIIVMILGLLFSASRMGIVSLLLSFSLMSFLFRKFKKGQRFYKTG